MVTEKLLLKDKDLSGMEGERLTRESTTQKERTNRRPNNVTTDDRTCPGPGPGGGPLTGSTEEVATASSFNSFVFTGRNWRPVV